MGISWLPRAVLQVQQTPPELATDTCAAAAAHSRKPQLRKTWVTPTEIQVVAGFLLPKAKPPLVKVSSV